MFKVGLIPAAALELEARCRQLLGVGITAAAGAGGNRVGTHFLQVFLRMLARGAAVFVNWHGEPLLAEDGAKCAAVQHDRKHNGLAKLEIIAY